MLNNSNKAEQKPIAEMLGVTEEHNLVDILREVHDWSTKNADVFTDLFLYTLQEYAPKLLFLAIEEPALMKQLVSFADVFFKAGYIRGRTTQDTEQPPGMLYQSKIRLITVIRSLASIDGKSALSISLGHNIVLFMAERLTTKELDKLL